MGFNSVFWITTLLPSLLLAVNFNFVRTQSYIPHTAECDPPNSSPVYILQHNITSGIALRTLPTNSFIDCSELCSAANDCIGVDYSSGQCKVIGKGDAQYQVAPAADGIDSRIIHKSCVKSERICASPFHFDAHEQKILVGFAREVVAAENIQACLSACLSAYESFGFECESLMYYPVDSECILNTEDRLDRPDLFVDEHEDKVIYLDNNCAGSQCYAPYVTQYVSVEGKQLRDELDRTVQGIDQAACEELCTQRIIVPSNNEDKKLDFNCKSFMYNKDTRTCILSDERSRPLGRGNLTDAVGYSYYEKKCFASPKTCRNTPSFTRVPQMLLVGFASFVMENVPSVTMCLDQCTNPPPETGEKFVCKSAMYYYNEQECILNAESRLSKPDLFIPEEDDFIVDYFDINCRLEPEQCPGNDSLQFYTVKTLNAALPEGDGALHVFTSVAATVEECKDKCIASAPEKCRSFNYDKVSSLCNMMYLDGRGSLRPQPKPSVDLYDLHCLQQPKQPSTGGCLNKDGALFSRYLYTKQRGSSSSEFQSVALSKCLNHCSTSEKCEGVNYNRRDGQCALFAQTDQEQPGEKSEHIDFYKNLCQTKELDNGLSSAVNVPKPVESAASSSTLRPKFTPHTKKPELVQQPDFRKPPGSDEKAQKQQLLEGPEELSKLPKPALPVAFGTPNQPGPAIGSVTSSNVSTTAHGSLEIKNVGAPASLPSPVLILPGSVHTICNYEGIKVQIKNDQPFTGVMFVKNKYDTCRVEVTKSDSATLVLGLPGNFGMKPISLNSQPNPQKKGPVLASPKTSGGTEKNEIRRRRQSERDCGLVDMDNGTYKSTVVVQTNNLGIPGLVTSMDQLYEISCNYSSMLGGKVTAATNLTVHGPAPAVIQPRGKIELGNPVLMQMTPVGNHNGSSQPLIQAKLGDILELRWEIMAMDEELDFLVRDCQAEPGVTDSKDSKEKLQIIEKGCPTPAVAQKLIPNPIQMQSSSVKIVHLQAFRFDSSSTVRITCHLELCKGDCKPAKCQLGAGEQDSWGRKKRDLSLQNEVLESNITQFETKRYKVPRFAQATTSLVIVDPLQQLTDPLASSNGFAAYSSSSRQSYVANSAPKYVSTEAHVAKAVVSGERCMNKWAVGGILTTLFALVSVQSVVVGKQLIARINSLKTNKP